jgi:hypothetical protein
MMVDDLQTAKAAEGTTKIVVETVSVRQLFGGKRLGGHGGRWRSSSHVREIRDDNAMHDAEDAEAAASGSDAQGPKSRCWMRR